MGQLNYLKIYTLFMGLAPDYILLQKTPKLVYNFWRIFLIGINFFTINMYVTYVVRQIRSNFKQDKRKISLQPFVQMIFVLTPLFVYACIGFLRLFLFLGNIFNVGKGKYEKLLKIFSEFWGKYTEVKAGYTIFSKQALLYFGMMMLSLARDVLRAYAVEWAVRLTPVYRPMYKTIINYLKAILAELNTFDALSLIIISLFHWLCHCISFLNAKLERLLKESNNRVFVRKFCALDVIHYYEDLANLWKNLRAVIGCMIFMNFLIWMVTLNFSGFFALTTSPASGPSWRMYRLTAQLDALCILFRFVFIDNVGHNLDKQVKNLSKSCNWK